jgi:hypothetical protein
LFRQVLQQQKYVAVLSVLNLVSDFVKCNRPIGLMINLFESIGLFT